jgi:hypothetical protein
MAANLKDFRTLLKQSTIRLLLSPKRVEVSRIETLHDARIIIIFGIRFGWGMFVFIAYQQLALHAREDIRLGLMKKIGQIFELIARCGAR